MGWTAARVMKTDVAETDRIYAAAALLRGYQWAPGRMADLKGLVSMVKNAGDVVVREAIKTGSS